MFRRGRPRFGSRSAGRVPEKIVNQVDDSRAEALPNYPCLVELKKNCSA